MIFSTIATYLRKFKLLAPLNYDQQVWGAKSLMDLYQQGSLLYLASADQNCAMATYWMGSQDGVTYVITVDVYGASTGPTKSNNPNVAAFSYPPIYGCAQAAKTLTAAGISEPWQHCTLEQMTEGDVVYYFTFLQHTPVTVNAMSNQIETGE